MRSRPTNCASTASARVPQTRRRSARLRTSCGRLSSRESAEPARCDDFTRPRLSKSGANRFLDGYCTAQGFQRLDVPGVAANVEMRHTERLQVCGVTHPIGLAAVLRGD